jgi:hypothetical protein
MLEYVGSYDFGGLTAVRCLNEPRLAGRTGFLFIFVVRQPIAHEAGDECLFQFQPVFVRSDGAIDDEAAEAAVRLSHVGPAKSTPVAEAKSAFDAARRYLEQKIGLWSWEDEVEFLALAWIEFR